MLFYYYLLLKVAEGMALKTSAFESLYISVIFESLYISVNFESLYISSLNLFTVAINVSYHLS